MPDSIKGLGEVDENRSAVFRFLEGLEDMLADSKNLLFHAVLFLKAKLVIRYRLGKVVTFKQYV